MPHAQRASEEGNETSSKRRPHKKSRRGCGNCKLRRVKCDEAHPHCKKCVAYGVSCNYDSNAPDLEMVFDGTATLQNIPPTKLPVPDETCLEMIAMPSSLTPPILADFDPQSLARMYRFQTRTVLTIGTPAFAKFYQGLTLQLACSNPFLMHIVQAMTANHDRHLTVPFNPQQTPMESYHLSRACALFNQKLSAPMQEEDRDPLWSAAALLGAVAFTWVHVSRPEEVWPLKPAESTDLEWLKMSENKMVIWHLTNPLRPGSIFSSMASTYQTSGVLDRQVKQGIHGVQDDFVQLCNMDESSTPFNNLYCAAVHALAPLLDTVCTREKNMEFLGFIWHMTPNYKELLLLKDPRALLLMAYWYAKVANAMWWIERRALLEGQSICLYLEKYHADDEMIRKMLEFPKLLLWPRG